MKLTQVLDETAKHYTPELQKGRKVWLATSINDGDDAREITEQTIVFTSEKAADNWLLGNFIEFLDMLDEEPIEFDQLHDPPLKKKKKKPLTVKTMVDHPRWNDFTERVFVTESSMFDH